MMSGLACVELNQIITIQNTRFRLVGIECNSDGREFNSRRKKNFNYFLYFVSFFRSVLINVKYKRTDALSHLIQ